MFRVRLWVRFGVKVEVKSSVNVENYSGAILLSHEQILNNPEQLQTEKIKKKTCLHTLYPLPPHYSQMSDGLV